MFKDNQNTFISLFEEPNKSLWTKSQPKIFHFSLSGQLQTRKPSSSKVKQGHYAISMDNLIELVNNVYKRHIDLNNIILERTQKPFTLRLTRNKKQIEFTISEFEFPQWFLSIRTYAIQRSFMEDYKLLKVQGEGNFAKVYKAMGKDNFTYAVKSFDKKNFKNVQLERDALRLEISIMRKIQFPSIIRLYEVYETEHHIWLVTDYLEGGELFEYLKHQPQGFSEIQVAMLMTNLLKALDYLHQQNIIHRDIKPENLIIRNSLAPTDICIADFGLADYYKPDGKYLFKRCGTPGYVAPEILQEKNYDCKVDIFSAGILMFIMLSGQSPFQTKSKNQLVIQNYNCEIDFNVNNLQMKITPEANQLLQILLSPNPEYRPNANQALNHPWFAKCFAPLNQMMQLANGLYLQPNLIPSFQQYQDIYCRTPIMNQMLNLSFSSVSNNSSNVTPSRSKSNTQQGVRTQSNSQQLNEKDQLNDQNQLIKIEEEEQMSDFDVQDEQLQIHQIKQYSMNTQKKQNNKKPQQSQQEHIIIE